MLKRILTVAMAAALCVSVSVGDAYAGKGASFSGGGRSSSFSGGRSSFSGGSSSGRSSSFSSGSRSSPSFSSSKPSFSGGSRPAAPSGGKSSFSGGSSRPSSPPSGGKSSFSGGSSHPSSPSGGGKSSFSGGSSKPNTTVTTKPIEGRTPVSVSKKPAANKFDSLAGADAKKVESRKAYERSQAPASTFKTPAGKEMKIDPKDKEINYLRGRLDQSKWENRQLREDNFYRSYSSRPLILYNDGYHPRWNYYLMSRPIDDIAMWIYMHQLSMDAARLNWYYSQNADLRARVARLEAERRGVRDTTWMPHGVDADLAYNEGYVNAAFNPTPRTVTVYEYGSPPAHVGWILLWIFVFIPLIILAVVAIYYMIFVYKW